MRSERSRNYFTLVFEGDLKAFRANPFKAETPFGKPVAAGYGDAFARIDELEEALWCAENPEPPTK